MPLPVVFILAGQSSIRGALIKIEEFILGLFISMKLDHDDDVAYLRWNTTCSEKYQMGERLISTSCLHFHYGAVPPGLEVFVYCVSIRITLLPIDIIRAHSFIEVSARKGAGARLKISLFLLPSY